MIEYGTTTAPAWIRRRSVTSGLGVGLVASRDHAFQRRDRSSGRRCRLLVRPAKFAVDLLAMHVDRAGSVDPHAHRVATHLDHRDHDVVADDDALAHTPGQYQHGLRLLINATDVAAH